MAYVQINSELPSSMVVNFVLGASGKPVALVYKTKETLNLVLSPLEDQMNVSASW